jgi:chaperonin GroES
MKVRPLYDRILVKRVEPKDTAKGSIIIPDTAKEKPMEAVVIEVGEGKLMEDGTVRKLELKAGDRVLIGKYAGTEIEIEGEEHIILREDDVLGVLED